MPHLQLKYSENLEPPGDIRELLSQLHCLLAETGGIALENCKSRSRVAFPFVVGSGAADSAIGAPATQPSK